jgi:hypothetical protein
MTDSGVALLIADLFANSNRSPRRGAQTKRGRTLTAPLIAGGEGLGVDSSYCVLALVFAGLGVARFLGVFISTRITSISASLAFSGLWRPAAVHIA